MHALETIHGLLKPNGRLIDIHPRGLPTPLYALDKTDKVLLGYIQETDDFIEYRQADEAIQNVLNRNMYGLMEMRCSHTQPTPTQWKNYASISKKPGAMRSWKTASGKKPSSLEWLKLAQCLLTSGVSRWWNRLGLGH